MEEYKTCCVTGHRDILTEKIEYVRYKLKEAVDHALFDGYRLFISGYARGIDLTFADIIVEQKEFHNDILLEAALPYRKWLCRKDGNFHHLLKKADKITICSEYYSYSCFMKRNIYMLDQSERVIAVHDGRKSGGTYNTISLAQDRGMDIYEIRI